MSGDVPSTPSKWPGTGQKLRRGFADQLRPENLPGASREKGYSPSATGNKGVSVVWKWEISSGFWARSLSLFLCLSILYTHTHTHTHTQPGAEQFTSRSTQLQADHTLQNSVTGIDTQWHSCTHRQDHYCPPACPLPTATHSNTQLATPLAPKRHGCTIIQ
uniref:Uncharacterized protein n=1 Tax=Rousettus aegyptiacus TaxID=9407 RepID=A0A7J8CID8_ROUAE|nr:hypothetical protein HJG63_009114 [Rousettus aegyptiacus]